MRRLIGIGLVTLVAVVVWAGLVLVGARYGWWRSIAAPRGDIAGFLEASKAKIARESKGNVALTLMHGGRAVGEYFASSGRPVDRNTLFQVASLSKWLTAWGVMTLVESGRIDLDAPVSRYLKRWKLPPSEFNNDNVTVRRLLSHTAGLTDDLGYRGFAPGQRLQTLPESLTQATDAMPERSGAVRVGVKPGSRWRYSGGGFALLQLLIEDVSGEPFNDYMRQHVLVPLGMGGSTYISPDASRLAEIFGPDGERAIHYKFTAVGAASLYTSTADLTRFVQAQLRGPHGEPPGRGVLRPGTIELMRRPQARLLFLPIWGLGTILYVNTDTGGFVVGHDGDNYPAISTAARFDPATGDGIIVLATGGSRGLASEIGSDWVHWYTGRLDFFAIFVLDAQRELMIFCVGALLIVIGATFMAWGGRRRKV